MGKTLVIQQLKSGTKLNDRQKKTLRALGLKGRGTTAVRSDKRAIRGMLNLVQHIVEAKQVDGPVPLQKEKADKKGYEIQA